MGKRLPLVTIGIPTYNRANSTLTMTLGSACNQDYPNLEIIVSDNCSIDNTAAIVSSFKNDKIRYIRQDTNIGPNNNYNACLSAAKGDYFLLLHDDDLVDEDFVSTCLKAAQYSIDFGFIRTGTRMIVRNGEVIKKFPNSVCENTPDALFSEWLSRKSPFYLCSTIFNTAALREIGGFKSNNNLFEDGFAIIKLSDSYPILNVFGIKASFRHHDEQRTHAAQSIHWSEDFRQALDIMYLQDPAGRAQLYNKGMYLFAKVSIQFARKVTNPFQKLKAMLFICKFFPYRYWPAGSWKQRAIGNVGKLIFREKKTSC